MTSPPDIFVQQMAEIRRAMDHMSVCHCGQCDTDGFMKTIGKMSIDIESTLNGWEVQDRSAAAAGIVAAALEMAPMAFARFIARPVGEEEEEVARILGIGFQRMVQVMLQSALNVYDGARLAGLPSVGEQ